MANSNKEKFTVEKKASRAFRIIDCSRHQRRWLKTQAKRKLRRRANRMGYQQWQEASWGSERHLTTWDIC